MMQRGRSSLNLEYNSRATVEHCRDVVFAYFAKPGRVRYTLCPSLLIEEFLDEGEVLLFVTHPGRVSGATERMHVAHNLEGGVRVTPTAPMPRRMKPTEAGSVPVCRCVLRASRSVRMMVAPHVRNQSTHSRS
jgi:hypothetical protein